MKSRKSFQEVCAELLAIQQEKVRQYGDARYLETDVEFNRWMCFSDVYRKFIRLRQQTKTATRDELLETYRDLANYAIMAIMIIEEELK